MAENAFQDAKHAFNLMFEEDDYVKSVTDMVSGPFAPATMEKWDIRAVGDLGVGDVAPLSIPVFLKSGAESKATFFYLFFTSSNISFKRLSVPT